MRAGWAVDAFPTAPLQYPGILRIEDLMIGAYEGRQRPPLDASHKGNALSLGSVAGRWARNKAPMAPRLQRRSSGATRPARPGSCGPRASGSGSTSNPTPGHHA